MWPGRNWPLGATWSEESTNFAVYAPDAESVWVCLFDEQDHEVCHELTERSLGIWHGALPGLAPGQRYGFRADGPWDPDQGLRFNRNKLLLDPYARAVSGASRPTRPSSASRPTTTSARRPTPHDATRATPRRTSPAASWSTTTSTGASDRKIGARWRDTAIYELHVKGFTAAARPDPRGAARDLRRPRAPGRHRLPAGPRHHRGRAAAGAAVRLRAAPARSSAWPTTGATTRSASSPRTRRTPPPATAASRSPSSSRW